MAKKSHLKDAQEEADVDMTPMIDVVFLLIIFFLCIDFKILEAKLPAYLPKDKGSSDDEAEPVEQLPLKIVNDVWGEEVLRKGTERINKETGRKNAIRLVGHKCHWLVGPRKYNDIDELKTALAKIANDRTRRVPDKDNPGQTKIMPIVIEPDVRTTYYDVATIVDIVSDVGFEEINFGGGRGSKK